MYDYEQKPVLLIGKHKLDALTGQHLPKNQKVFRYYNYQTQETSYFYRTQEKLVGQSAKPVLIKKNYRLGTRSLNTLSLTNLAYKDKKKEIVNLTKSKLKLATLQQDFQEFLVTLLLPLCKTAEFVHIPVEKNLITVIILLPITSKLNQCYALLLNLSKHLLLELLAKN